MSHLGIADCKGCEATCLHGDWVRGPARGRAVVTSQIRYTHSREKADTIRLSHYRHLSIDHERASRLQHYRQTGESQACRHRGSRRSSKTSGCHESTDRWHGFRVCGRSYQNVQRAFNSYADYPSFTYNVYIPSTCPTTTLMATCCSR